MREVCDIVEHSYGDTSEKGATERLRVLWERYANRAVEAAQVGAMLGEDDGRAISPNCDDLRMH